MKSLTFTVVFLVATAIGVGFRHAVSGSSQAAPSLSALKEEKRLQLPEQTPPAVVRPARADSLQALATTVEQAEPDEVTLARVAARCGDHLLALARRHPEREAYLYQALQHYQACLAHEPTLRDPEGLFTTVRARLVEIDSLRKARAVKPAAPVAVKPAPRATVKRAEPPVPKPVPAAPVVVAPPPALMVGPDGVPIERTAPLR